MMNRKGEINMKKTLNIVSIMLAIVLLVCTSFALVRTGKAEEQTTLTQDVMTYFDNHKQEIDVAIKEASGNMFTADDVRGELEKYVSQNEENIQGIIDDLVNGNYTYEEKVSMIQGYIYGALYAIIDGATGGWAAFLSTQINAFAAGYAPKVAEEYKDWLASMISDGSLFYILAIIIETAVIVTLIVINRKKSVTANDSQDDNE